MKLPTHHASSQQWMAQHSSVTTRQLWMAQHAISLWCWTVQQPMEPQRRIHHGVDKTPPSWRVLAVRCSHQCQHLSTRLHWSILCPCGLCCSDGWNRVWRFRMPRPGRLHSQLFLFPEMTHHPGGQTRRLGLQKDDPGRRSDGPDSCQKSQGVGRHVRVFSVTFSSYKVFISWWQYQLFRQAVTTSKGSFKVNPAKTSRASFLDLGDSEVTDRVSCLDQPSLKDMMASTARIAQGLKEDEEVEKTTLSETLNTASSTFKHLTVKQIFPREPYRLKVHRDSSSSNFIPNRIQQYNTGCMTNIQGCHTSGKSQGKIYFFKVREFEKMSGKFWKGANVREMPGNFMWGFWKVYHVIIFIHKITWFLNYKLLIILTHHIISSCPGVKQNSSKLTNDSPGQKKSWSFIILSQNPKKI